MDEEFLSNFKKKDKIILKEYFIKLNNTIDLTKKDTKLFNEDFKKAILFYYNKKKRIPEILDILSIENLGMCYSDIPSKWYSLDNSEKIYPLSMKQNWMSVYRLSYYLNEEIVPEILQIALTFTMKRFPTFRTNIRKGFFWHYIDEIKKRFPIYEDKRLPCSYINVSSTAKQSFKAVYYKNRISVEFFHILTDGHGGEVFISTLVATYLNLLGKNITSNGLVLDINKDYDNEEIKDEFINKTKSKKTNSLMESKAVQIDGKLSNISPTQILHFDMNVNELKKVSSTNNASLTEFIITILFLTLYRSSSGNGNIKIQIPVDMRNYYPSKTLRNFSLYVVISIDRKNITTYDNVLKEVKKQMKEKNNLEYLSETMTYANKLVNGIRCIPLFIKRPIASIIYGFAGDKAMTSVLSNIGKLDIPESMNKYIEKADFVLGTGITNRALFTMVSVNNVLTLSITKYTNNTSVENILYSLLKEYNINVKVHGSEQYENRK